MESGELNNVTTNGISSSMSQTLLTPELAKLLTERVHPRQRRVLQVVERYAAEMKAGNWKLVPDPILIDRSTGMLFNGLQRCNAVLKSGMSVPVYIDWESDASLFEVIDTGAARKAGQFVTGKYRSAKAAAARLILWHERNADSPITAQTLQFPFGDVIRTAEGWTETFDKYAATSSLINNRLGISAGAVLAACSIADEAGYADQVAEFLDGLLNPATLTANDPAWTVFEKYSRRHVRQRNRQIADDWYMFVRGLNAHINDEKIGARMTLACPVSPVIGETEHSLNRRRVNEINRSRAALRRTQKAPAASFEPAVMPIAAAAE